jgi:hypothetical protein
MEGNFALAAPDWQSFDVYQRGSNTLHRLLAGIGLDRVPRDATPDLKTYLESAA